MSYLGMIGPPKLRSLITYDGLEVGTISVGTGPRGVAFTPDSRYAFVVNYGSNTVSQISVASSSVIATINVGTGPVAVAVSPDGTLAYVCNDSSDTLTRIVIATGATSTIAVGNGPRWCAFTPDGIYLYVCNIADNNVYKLRVSDGVNVATINTGQGPIAVDVSSNGLIAYVSCYDAGVVSRIDVVTDAVISFACQLGVHAIKFSPDGIHAYVSSNSTTPFLVIGTDGNSVVSGGVTGNNGLGVSVSPDGSMVYVALNSNTNIVRFDITSNILSNIVATTGTGPWSVAFSPDGTVAYITKNSANSVSVIRLRA